MPFFAFSCGLRRVTLRCPYDSTASYGFLRLPTASYDLCSLYDFVVVCTFTNFKHRKTVARRHVVGSTIVRAPYGNPAMIVRSPHDFMIIWGLVIVRHPYGYITSLLKSYGHLTSYGYHRETARNLKDSSRPSHGLRKCAETL